jgi:hypothetical protein
MSSEYEFEFDLHDIPAQDHRIKRFIENAEESESLDATAFTDKKWHEVNQVRPGISSMMHIFMKNGEYVVFHEEDMIKGHWNQLDDPTQILIITDPTHAVKKDLKTGGIYSIVWQDDISLILEKENISKSSENSHYLLMSSISGQDLSFSDFMDKMESMHLSTKAPSVVYVVIIVFILVMLVLYFTLQ